MVVVELDLFDTDFLVLIFFAISLYVTQPVLGRKINQCFAQTNEFLEDSAQKI